MMRLRTINFSTMIKFGVGVMFEESQLQAYRVNHIIKHGGGAIFVWGCIDFPRHGLHVQEGKMTQAPYLSILQDG